MDLLKFTTKLAEKAGKHILQARQKSLQVKEKQLNDFVTNVDQSSEELIIKAIKKQFPDHEIIAEESHTASKKNLQKLLGAPYIWIIDPIDGTRNFVRGIPNYCVSIAVFENTAVETSKNYQYLEGEIIAAAVCAPALQETYSAAKNCGAYLNGKPIKVSQNIPLQKAIFATGFPPEHREKNLAYFNKVTTHTGAVRRLGAAALDLCFLAAGRLDGFWEFGLKPWDIAAGALILEEAGGKSTDLNGQPLDLFGQEILSTNGELHQESIDLLRRT